MKRFWQILTPLVVLSIGIWIWPYPALAATVGPNNCVTAVDDASVGTISWTNVTNACGEDAALATAGGNSAPFDNVDTHYIKATNFGFAIPVGATINGILVEIKDKDNTIQGQAKDVNVRLIRSNSTLGATNKANTTTGWGSTLNYKSYGSSSDVWGETFASTDINSSNFGVAINAHLAAAAGSGGLASVDNIRITVTYTLTSNHAQVTIASGIVTQPKGITIIN